VQIKDAGGGTLDYTYNYSVVLESVGPAPTGETAKQKQYQFDGLGRLMSVCEVSSLPGSNTCSQSVNKTGYWTLYTYNTLGNLTAVTQNAQPGGTQQTRSFSYDKLGRMLSETNPETGTTTYTYDTVTITGCSSTSSGDLVLRTDAMGNKTCYKYDALHRVTDITYPAGSYAAITHEKHFVYDTTPLPGYLAYNGTNITMQNTKGRLVRAYTGTSASKRTDLFYSYTVRGEIADIFESTSTSGSNYYRVSGTYWEHGLQKTQQQLKRATAAAGSEFLIDGMPPLEFKVDGAGRISWIDAATGTDPLINTGYAAGGASPLGPSGYMVGVTYGSGDWQTFTFDLDTGRMKQYKSTLNATQIVQGDLTWNDNGSLQKLTVTNPLHSASAMTCNYTHDDLSRIKSVDCGATKWQQNFSYDAFGNIKKAVPTGGTGVAFDPNYSAITNRYTSLPGVTPTYDTNGNLTSDGTHTYSWDAEGNPLGVDTVSVAYDAFGRTLERTISGNQSRVIYGLTGEKIAIVSGITLTVGRVSLPGGTAAIYNSSGLSYYRHADWLGSARFGSTPSRTMQYSRSVAPFGESYTESSTTDRAYTGQNQDTVTGIYDFMFRRYDPVQGRWISPDPVGVAAVNPAAPQSWNRYAYVMNNPLNLVDPLGLDPCIGIIGRDSNGVPISGPVPCPPKGPEPGEQGESPFSGQPGPGARAPSCAEHPSCANQPTGPFGPTQVGDGGSNPTPTDEKPCPATPKPNLLPHSVATIVNGEVTVGLSKLGATAQGTGGFGLFGGTKPGAFGTYVATAVAGSKVIGTPTQPLGGSNPTITGAYVGAGGGVMITNATSVHQLSGNAQQFTLSLPKVSFSFSYANGIWSFGATYGPIKLPAATTSTTTNTEVLGPC
jgi:RHS repeat-associated protein